ncbi:unnamed protein product [Rhizophagus irregularis]|nr:unnamed protein product [Rhizophagus irregularis]
MAIIVTFGSRVPVLQVSETAKCSVVPVLQDSRNGKCSGTPGIRNGKMFGVLQDSETSTCSGAPGFRNGKMSPIRVSLESENGLSGILDFGPSSPDSNLGLDNV